MKGLEQERLAERTTMGAALDEMLVGQLDEQGLQLEEALAAAEAAAEAEAAAAAELKAEEEAAAAAAARAGGSKTPRRKPRQPAAAATAPRGAAGGGEELSKCTVVQLKERLRAAGLPVSGRKAELIERLAGASQPPE